MNTPDSPQKTPSDIAKSSSYMEGSHILESNLNYTGFLEQLKREGLKGKIKLWIFKVIGFFAWWQEQVNSALYNKLVKQSEMLAGQQAQLARQNEQITKQEAQLAGQQAQLARQNEQITKQEAQLAGQQAQLARQNEQIAKQEAQLAGQKTIITDRDKVIEDLYHKLSLSSRLEDVLYEELTSQRAEMVRHRRYIDLDKTK